MNQSEADRLFDWIVQAAGMKHAEVMELLTSCMSCGRSGAEDKDFRQVIEPLFFVQLNQG